VPGEVDQGCFGSSTDGLKNVSLRRRIPIGEDALEHDAACEKHYNPVRGRFLRSLQIRSLLSGAGKYSVDPSPIIITS
jgi:hypothetical protein